MKRILVYWLLLSVIIVTTVFLKGCQTDKDSTDWLPDYPAQLSTRKVTSVTMTTAVSGGSSFWGGRAPVTAKGVCWSTSSNPSVVIGKTNEGTGSGFFTSKLTGLSASTKYIVWAYATNSYGNAGGGKIEFTTAPEVPVVTTSPVIYFTNTSAKAEGWVTSQGLTPVTERGVFWSASPNPEITGKKVQAGADTGRFSVNLTGLTPLTTYYIKAYATNSLSTSTGDQTSFVTKADYSLPGFSTAPVVKVTNTSAECTADLPWDGGSEITERGLCWSTSENPTTADHSSITSYRNEYYTAQLTELLPNTNYYVRAYAINSLGTAYSTQVSFKTRTGILSDNEGNNYYTQTIGTQVWMAENLKTTTFNDGTQIPLVTGNTAWGSLTTPAYCWYNNSPYYKNQYGAIYNWHTVKTGKLCPSGWRVPAKVDWEALETFLGGANVAGGYMKETGIAKWNYPNTLATNESGFSAIPTGSRSGGSGNFSSDDSGVYDANWWSATQYDEVNGWFQGINNLESRTYQGWFHKSMGLSVRCIKN